MKLNILFTFILLATVAKAQDSSPDRIAPPPEMLGQQVNKASGPAVAPTNNNTANSPTNNNPANNPAGNNSVNSSANNPANYNSVNSNTNKQGAPGNAAGAQQGTPQLVPALNVNTNLPKSPDSNITGVNEDSSLGLSQRDPFRLPKYLILKIKEKAIATKSDSGVIDDSIEPIRRWPLSNYQLVGIIWDVRRPKAMFVDRLNSIHMLHIKDHIGNGGGIISVINNGEVVVIENKTPLRLKLKK